MKVNEIVSEGQVWNGIKQVGKGLGNVIGGAATGVVRGLDALGGGSGQVGTRSQIAARNAEKKRKALAQSDQQLPREALGNFEAELSQQGIDLDDLSGVNPRQLGTMLQSFAARFFAGAETRDIQNYIIKTLPYEPIPAQFNRTTIENYFGEVAKIRQNARAWVDQNREEIASQKEKEAQAAADAAEKQKTAEPAAPGLANGVSVLSMEPMVLQVGKQRYYVADDGLWHEVGNRNPVDSTWGAFLTQQADIATPESNVRATGSDEVTPAAPTPAEIRARKQADAIARARSQLGPR